MSTAVAEVFERHQVNPLVVRRCVLIVEDDTDMQSLLAEALAAAGYDIVVAEDALGARAHLRSGRIAAVLLDVRLPGLSGMHVCREIRRDPATANLPVIMMTGDDRPDVVEACLRAGATVQLVKPVPMEEIVRLLHANW